MPYPFRFDPFGWLTRIVPEFFVHLLIQLCAILACGYFVYIRIENYHHYVSKLLWAAETALFLFFGMAYAVRVKPGKRSNGFAEIIIPLIATILPMTLVYWPSGGKLLAITPENGILEYPMVYNAVISVIIFGNLFTCVAVISLQRSFSITPEARRLITTGFYRFVRHPVYLGELVAAFGVAIARFNLRNGILYALFVVLQVWRAFREERKLASAFPEYPVYKTRTGLLFPSFKKWISAALPLPFAKRSDK